MRVADYLALAAAVLLVLMAAAFSNMEAALSRVSRSRVAELVAEGRRGARRLQTVVGQDVPGAPHYLNVLLLLRHATELTATVLVAFVCIEEWGAGWLALLVAAASMTLLSYVLIGVASRTLGRQHADRIGLATAGVAVAFARLLGPLPKLLIILGNAVTPGKGYRDGPFTSEAELRDLVDLAEERQVIEAGERRMIHSVFELGDTMVREVMVPRTDIVFIERAKTVRQALSLALRSGYSRIPVVGESEDDVVGFAYLKDLARRSYDHRRGQSTETVDSVMRPAAFVPDTKPVDELLQEMQAARNHVAIVIDEYGGTAGLVTIEDILEEIVGEITDEYDVEAPRHQPVSDREARVSVRFSLEELDELYGTDLACDDVETVGGLLARELGRVPIPGSTIEVQGLRLTTESGQGRRNRVGTVLVARIESPASVPPPVQAHADV
ncbi:MAG: hemolysin family protein [Frankiaceae bacterium]